MKEVSNQKKGSPSQIKLTKPRNLEETHYARRWKPQQNIINSLKGENTRPRNQEQYDIIKREQKRALRNKEDISRKSNNYVTIKLKNY